jgi:hypothetical protein
MSHLAHDPSSLPSGQIIVQCGTAFTVGPDDPLFFESSVAVPLFLSDESTDEIWKSLLQAAGDSGIDPAIVYAMNKTGRIVTETNVHFLTDAELQEWNDAVDEYRQKVEAGETQ